MNKSKFITIVSTILIIITLFNCGESAIPDDELNSYKWLISNLQINIDISTIECNSSAKGTRILCTPDYHISDIIIVKGTVTGSYSGDYGVSYFTFPYLKAMMVEWNINKDILIMFNATTMNNLQSITLTNPFISEIPQEISLFPKLIMATIYSSSFKKLPKSILYSSIKILETTSVFNEIEWDNNLSSQIEDLSISVQLNDSLDISRSRMGSLKRLVFALGSDIDVSIEVTNLTYVSLRSISGLNGNITLYGNKSTLTDLEILATFKNFTPSNITLFENLRNFALLNILDISKYTDNPLPLNISSIKMHNIAFPNLIYKGSNKINIRYSKVSGNIPDEYYSFTNQLVLDDSPNFSEVPEKACTLNLLHASNTNVSSVPDCFKCWWGVTSSNFLSTPFYNSFDSRTYLCQMTYDESYKSYDGKTFIVKGKNLGWFKESNMSPQFNASLGYSNNNWFVYSINQSTVTKNVKDKSEIFQISKNPPISIFFNYTIETFSISKIDMSQYEGSTHVVIYGNFSQPNISHTVEIGGAIYTNFAINQSRIELYTSAQPGGLTSVKVSNQYNDVTISYNFDLQYPRVSGAPSLTPSSDSVVIYGQFNVTEKTSVAINDKPCILKNITSSLINCTVSDRLSVGYQSLLIIQEAIYQIKTDKVVVVLSDPKDLVEFCMKETKNCSGNGECDQTGKCHCAKGYFGVSCGQTMAQLPPVLTNGSIPVATIGDSLFTFSFSIVSIQELGQSNNVVKELFVGDTWNVTRIGGPDQYDGVTTNIYTQRFLDKDEYKDVVLTLLIHTTSDKPKTFNFASEEIVIPPNSIKLTLNITGWKYESQLTSLRFIFSSPVFSQTECSDVTGDVVKDKDNITVQYLRIFKDNIEYLGRFLSIAISDGRSVFAKTEIVGESKNSKETLVGISMPQCDLCIIDPDFSALVSTGRATPDGCKKETNKTWIIVTACVVGGVVLIGVVITIAKSKSILRKFRQWKSVRKDSRKARKSIELR